MVPALGVKGWNLVNQRRPLLRLPALPSHDRPHVLMSLLAHGAYGTPVGASHAAVQSVADAAYFLPAYDLRQATLALAALRERQEAAAAALQPRKRFAFNRRASKAPPAASTAQGPEEPVAEAEARGLGELPKPLPQAPRQAPAPTQQQQPGQQEQPPPGGSSREQEQGGASPAVAAACDAAGGAALSGLRGRVVAVSRPDAAGREFTLTDLEDCSVHLLAPLAALFLHGLRRCRVFTGPVAGACFVEGEVGPGYCGPPAACCRPAGRSPGCRGCRGWEVLMGRRRTEHGGPAARSARAGRGGCCAHVPLHAGGSLLSCLVVQGGQSRDPTCGPASARPAAGAEDCVLMIAAQQVCCRTRRLLSSGCMHCWRHGMRRPARAASPVHPMRRKCRRQSSGAPPSPHPLPSPRTNTHIRTYHSPLLHPRTPGARPLDASLRPLPPRTQSPRDRALCRAALCTIRPRL